MDILKELELYMNDMRDYIGTSVDEGFDGTMVELREDAESYNQEDYDAPYPHEFHVSISIREDEDYAGRNGTFWLKATVTLTHTPTATAMTKKYSMRCYSEYGSGYYNDGWENI